MSIAVTVFNRRVPTKRRQDLCQTSLNFLLDFLRKDHLHRLPNLLPKPVNASPDSSGNKSGGLILLLFTQIEKAVGPSLGNPACVDFNHTLFQHEFLRMQEVVDGNWVVVGREGPFPGLFVELLIMQQHVIEGLAEGMVAIGFEVAVDLFVSEE